MVRFDIFQISVLFKGKHVHHITLYTFDNKFNEQVAHSMDELIYSPEWSQPVWVLWPFYNIRLMRNLVKAFSEWGSIKLILLDFKFEVNSLKAGLVFLVSCFFCFYYKEPKITAICCLVSSLSAILLTVHMLIVFNIEEEKLREIWIHRRGVAGLWAIVGSVITSVFEIINTPDWNLDL